MPKRAPTKPASQELEPCIWSIDGIELISSTVDRKPATNFNGNEFKFDLETEIKANAERQLLLVNVRIFIKDINALQELANLSVVCAYNIHNFNVVIKPNSDGSGIYDIPENLAIALNSVSLSTCRGILWSQLKGTYLHRAVLPVFDPKDFISIKKTNR